MHSSKSTIHLWLFSDGKLYCPCSPFVYCPITKFPNFKKNLEEMFLRCYMHIYIICLRTDYKTVSNLQLIILNQCQNYSKIIIRSPILIRQIWHIWGKTISYTRLESLDRKGVLSYQIYCEITNINILFIYINVHFYE